MRDNPPEEANPEPPICDFGVDPVVPPRLLVDVLTEVGAIALIEALLLILTDSLVLKLLRVLSLVLADVLPL